MATETITPPRTARLYIEEEERMVTLYPGKTYQVVEDGDGSAFSGVYKRIWRKYAAQIDPELAGRDATEEALDLALRMEINVLNVDGTGEDGRILKGDVEDYLEQDA